MLHLDSTFLIDLLRETTSGRPGGALDFIEGLDEREILTVSAHVLCELRTGAELARQPVREHEVLDELLSGLLVAVPGEGFAPLYGRVLASLRKMGQSVPSMDLLIATSALLDDAPLVTRNVKDFQRIPGLRVQGY